MQTGEPRAHRGAQSRNAAGYSWTVPMPGRPCPCCKEPSSCAALTGCHRGAAALRAPRPPQALPRSSQGAQLQRGRGSMCQGTRGPQGLGSDRPCQACNYSPAGGIVRETRAPWGVGGREASVCRHRCQSWPRSSLEGCGESGPQPSQPSPPSPSLARCAGTWGTWGVPRAPQLSQWGTPSPHPTLPFLRGCSKRCPGSPGTPWPRL